MHRLVYSGFLLLWACHAIALEETVYIRANQVGYSPRGTKIALVLSREPVSGTFHLLPAAGTTAPVFQSRARRIEGSWGPFSNFVSLDFSKVTQSGSYVLEFAGARSHPFEIGGGIGGLPDICLEFMRQQRCGYNPWLDAECHQHDARTAYGPLPEGTYLDARGGWHDAGDLLKYMLTSGNATAQMLLAYQLSAKAPTQHKASLKSTTLSGTDHFNALGQPGANGVPDLLDEARWGLDWLLKLHPAPGHLYHQVADDRDHAGLRLPHEDPVDYGWGKGSNRVVYFADGKPQGLQQYKSVSTGVANLAGRYAAAMALAWQVWHRVPGEQEFAERCLQAGKEVYELGRAREGVQQGNSYKAPYRYEETTWADDMEWGAAELYRVTGEKRYLEDAWRYARLAGAESWMGQAEARHYQYFPFMNLGHFRLYELADARLRRELAGYYREGIERCVQASSSNPFRAGVPFIWCSANLSVALATQCMLYERMTGDTRFADFGAAQRDWLLGRNPWGYTMFTGVGSVFPTEVHLQTTWLTRRSVRGGLIDGPVYDRIFKSLKGVSITEPDPLAEFQGLAVYHNDFKDYSTNEPIMDGTAAAILLWTLAGNLK